MSVCFHRSVVVLFRRCFPRINGISSFSWQFRMQFPWNMWNSSSSTVYTHICRHTHKHLSLHPSIKGKMPWGLIWFFCLFVFFNFFSLFLVYSHCFNEAFFHNLSAFLFTIWQFCLGTFPRLPNNKLLLLQIFREKCSTSISTVTLTEVWAHPQDKRYQAPSNQVAAMKGWASTVKSSPFHLQS